MRFLLVRAGFDKHLPPKWPLVFCLFLLLSGAMASYGADDVKRVGQDEARRLMKQADKLVRYNEFIEAEALLRRALEINPANSNTKLKLAYVLLKQRRLVEAFNLCGTVAVSEPRNTRAMAVMGAALLAAGKFDDARKIFYTAIKLNRREGLAWAGYGLLDFYENRIDESIENLKMATLLEPSEPDFIFALAQVSARAERYKEAADAYFKFLSVSRGDNDERKTRIKGLIRFLRFLGSKSRLYELSGADQTSVPLMLTGNRPIINIKVNGGKETLNFVLDTGSGISVISDETARKLGLKPVARGGQAKGIGGDGKFDIVYGFLRDVQIGDVKVRNVPVYIRPFHARGLEIDGYIGLSLISKFLTTIDYGNLSFALEKRGSDRRNFAAESSISLPLRLTSSGFLSGEVKLEGIEYPLNFIVDTGASISVISDELASVHPVNQFEQNEKLRVVGSAGIAEDVPSFRLPQVSFGTHSRRSVDAVALDLNIINEASGFEQSGILGGNFLRNYRMTFDFKNSRVTFSPVTREQ